MESTKLRIKLPVTIAVPVQAVPVRKFLVAELLAIVLEPVLQLQRSRGANACHRQSVRIIMRLFQDRPGDLHYAHVIKEHPPCDATDYPANVTSGDYIFQAASVRATPFIVRIHIGIVIGIGYASAYPFNKTESQSLFGYQIINNL